MDNPAARVGWSCEVWSYGIYAASEHDALNAEKAAGEFDVVGLEYGEAVAIA